MEPHLDTFLCNLLVETQPRQGVWMSPERETPQSPWTACFSALPRCFSPDRAKHDQHLTKQQASLSKLQFYSVVHLPPFLS